MTLILGRQDVEQLLTMELTLEAVAIAINETCTELGMIPPDNIAQPSRQHNR